MTFETVPANALVPMFYAEVNASKANAGAAVNRPTLLIGQKVASGTGTAYVPVRSTSEAQDAQVAGYGSHLQRMAKAARRNDPYAEIWLLPISDDASGVVATGKVTISGSPTAAGTLALYVAGQVVNVPVTTSSTPTSIGAFLQDYLGVNEAGAIAIPSGAALGYRTTPSEVPVICSAAAGVCTLTARNAGALGNQIDLRFNYLGAAGGESTPAGLTAVVTNAMGGLQAGATDPDLSGAAADPAGAAFVNASTRRYSFIGHAYTDSANLAAFKAEMADTTSGRWGPIRQQYGTAFSAKVDSFANLTDGTHLPLKNDPHASVLGIAGSPTPPWEIAGAYVARAAQSARNDPALPLNTLELIGVLPPAEADRLPWGDRNVMLGVGVTTPTVTDAGAVLVERAVSTYTKNAGGAADAAYRDVTTGFTLDHLLTGMASLVATRYARVKLVSDAATPGPGQKVIRPKDVKSALVSLYKGWEREALVEDAATFARLLVVERDSDARVGGDPTRLNVLFPPALAAGLMIFAALAEFRLAYTAEERAAA